MELNWRDQNLALDAQGSDGFQFVIWRGDPVTVIQRTWDNRKQHRKQTIHKQQRVTTVTEAKAVAQAWENGK